MTKISKNLPERDKKFLENLFHEYCILSEEDIRVIVKNVVRKLIKEDLCENELNV